MTKKVIHHALIFSSVLLMSGCAMYHYKEGNRLYEQMAYHEAIPEYQRALSKKEIDDAHVKLADCFVKTNNVDMALDEYAKAVQLNSAEPRHYLEYARLLMRKGRTADAKVWFDKYLEKMPNDSAVKELSASAAAPEDFKKDSLAWLLKSEKVNSGESNFSPVYLNNKIVFTSDRGSSSWRKQYAWTGRPFLNMFQSKVDSTGEWSAPEPLTGDVNGKYHDGPAAFTGDGKTMYFTRNNYTLRKVGKSEHEVVNLKIFEATAKDTSWTEMKELPFNSNDFSCGHPAVSKDGKHAVFCVRHAGRKGRNGSLHCPQIKRNVVGAGKCRPGDQYAFQRNVPDTVQRHRPVFFIGRAQEHGRT
jgi:hypothetical protein